MKKGKETKNGKIKQFFKDHKEEIAAFAIVAWSVGVYIYTGYCFGFGHGLKKGRLLEDIDLAQISGLTIPKGGKVIVVGDNRELVNPDLIVGTEIGKVFEKAGFDLGNVGQIFISVKPE